MTDTKLFALAPFLRCCAPVTGLQFSRCGARAAWSRSRGPLDVAAYFCDDHHEPSDAPIAGELPILRVHFVLEAYIAGVFASPKDATAEAYERIEREARHIGAAIGFVRSTAEVGRGSYSLAPGQRPPFRRRG